MKKAIIILLAFLYVGISSAQEKEKKKSKFKLKMPELNIREKLGNLAGSIMTSTTKELDGVVAKPYITSGIYPPEIETTDSKLFPKGTIEGDYLVGVTFLKGEGVGMFKVDGTVTCEGQEMEYIGLGTYLFVYRTPFTTAKTINIKTSSGDEASFTLKPIPKIEILSINGERSLPIIDIAEDIKLTYFNPAGSKGSRIRVSLITDVAGGRFLNHFASFDAGDDGEVTVTIPKESLSNPEVSGSVKGVGNFNKGENFFILEREFITEKDKMDPLQKTGDLKAAEIKANTYTSFPVIIKGKQDESVYSSIKVNSKDKNGIGYTFYKPNANSGIPFSKGSKFGLTSFTLEGKTFSSNTTTGERYGYGNTRTITTTTTTYKFPQLPAKQWQFVMDKIYNGLVTFMKSEYNIEFVPIEKITSNANYVSLYPTKEDYSEKIIRTTYKNTQRVDPKSLGEILGSVNSNNTSDNAIVDLMKDVNVDGLVSMQLNFQVAGNSDGKVVLIPSITLSITGRDEENNNKQGTYASAYIINTVGKPFNGYLVKTNPNALAQACSTDEMIKALAEGIRNLRTKEVALGYDKIWNIGK